LIPTSIQITTLSEHSPFSRTESVVDQSRNT